jgi:hypothetical protein
MIEGSQRMALFLDHFYKLRVLFAWVCLGLG